jgi:hypothetical protein
MQVGKANSSAHLLAVFQPRSGNSGP